jgi:hypothetical protein
VEHRRDHDREAHVGQLRTHGALALDDVGVDVGQGAVVADGTHEHERLAGLDHRVHDAAGQHPGADGLADRSRGADRVDRADVVLVAVRHTGALGEVDAEGRAEQRGLDVVGGQCVAGEQDVDVAGPHQPHHGR